MIIFGHPFFIAYSRWIRVRLWLFLDKKQNEDFKILFWESVVKQKLAAKIGSGILGQEIIGEAQGIKVFQLTQGCNSVIMI